MPLVVIISLSNRHVMSCYNYLPNFRRGGIWIFQVANSTITIVRPIDTSYDIICDTDLIAPKNTNFIFLNKN
ncbi:hypothetical protein [Ehrlichia ruminantium]